MSIDPLISALRDAMEEPEAFSLATIRRAAVFRHQASRAQDNDHRMLYGKPAPYRAEEEVLASLLGMTPFPKRTLELEICDSDFPPRADPLGSQQND